MSRISRALVEKIEALPPDQIPQVEEFVDLISGKVQDRALVKAAAETSVASFSAVWSNPEDDVYDAL